MILDSSKKISARLNHLVIASPDPQALAAFYERAMEMSIVEEGNSITAEGPNRHLVFIEGAPKTFDIAGYAVENAADIEALQRRCAEQGVAVSTHEDHLFLPGAIAVRDPDGNRIAFGQTRTSITPDGRLPARLQHLVVASTDARRLSQFYQQTLGFVLSDDVVDEDGGLRAAFLRCSEEHHSFAVFQANRCWFDHHCYEAGDWGLIRDWGDHFAQQGIAVQWGPGRHGPGNNLFMFVHDLDGNWLEISAELETVGPDRPVGIWKHEQRTLNKWGSAPLRS